jgi:hypothetical protein
MRAVAEANHPRWQTPAISTELVAGIDPSRKPDVLWVGPIAPDALYAILVGRFFHSHPFLDE